MKNPVRTLGLFIIAVGVLYLASGSESFRWLRARIDASLQPPTAEQMQRVTADAGPLAAGLSRRPARGDMWLADPPTRFDMILAVASILSAAVLVMYGTGRSR